MTLIDRELLQQLPAIQIRIRMYVSRLRDQITCLMKIRKSELEIGLLMNNCYIDHPQFSGRRRLVASAACAVIPGRIQSRESMKRAGFTPMVFWVAAIRPAKLSISKSSWPPTTTDSLKCGCVPSTTHSWQKVKNASTSQFFYNLFSIKIRMMPAVQH